MDANLQKTLRNLRLPDSFGMLDGILTNRIVRTLVQTRVHDYTQLVRIDGKLKPKVVDTYSIEETSTAYNQYALNQLDWELQDKHVELKLESPEEIVFGRDKFFATVELGYFAGNTYWYAGNESTIKLNPDNTFTFDKVIDLGMASNLGVPEPSLGENPPITIIRREYVKTKTYYSPRPSTSYPKYLLNDLIEAMGTTLEDLKYDMRTSYALVPKDQFASNKITNTSVEALFTMNKDGSILADAKVYYNGVDTDVKKPSGMITSYNKVYPGHVVRWRLYDGVVNENVYGSSAMIQFDSAADDRITIVAGNSTNYNSETKTLTYNVEDGATLWVTFEEKPAQGKNWGNEAMYFLMPEVEPVRI